MAFKLRAAVTATPPPDSTPRCNQPPPPTEIFKFHADFWDTREPGLQVVADCAEDGEGEGERERGR
eukprot:2166862-Rhodomonas_salina.1